ncbi:MAG: AI-2E family transporter [Hyphomonadaceae bacterium]
MDTSLRAAIWIIATGVVVVGLYWFRDVLTQFALALILWLAIDSLTRFLDEKIPAMPRWLALPIALVLVLALVTVVISVIAFNAAQFGESAGGYEARLNALIAEGHRMLGLSGPPATVGTLLAETDPRQLVSQIGAALQGVASDTVFILIYLGFLFSAAAVFPEKLDRIFRDKRKREGARRVFTSIRLSMQRYLWVQTIVSLIITAFTYATLTVIGLDNALFWAFVIFFLNYIPTIGSIIAVVLPTAFALVQFPTLAPVLAVAGGVGFWQFVIGNFVQPRMTGETLNLSAVVVLLALAVWGFIWGITGAFLAAPLTVMIMIVLAQFRATRWIAILLSADGKPTLAPAQESDAETAPKE